MLNETWMPTVETLLSQTESAGQFCFPWVYSLSQVLSGFYLDPGQFCVNSEVPKCDRSQPQTQFTNINVVPNW